MKEAIKVEYVRKLPVVLNFVCKRLSNKRIDYSNSFFTLRDFNQAAAESKGISFLVLSDQVSLPMANYDIMTFYITFILVIGQVIRGIIVNEAERIVFTEMPQPKCLINLCEGTKISRYRMQFKR